MDKTTIEKILRGNKTTINIKGHIYDVDIRENEIILTNDTGSDASSRENSMSYSYSRGGDIYREAVRVAWELREAYIAILAESSDV